MAEPTIDDRRLVLFEITALCDLKPRFAGHWVKVGCGLKFPDDERPDA